MQESLQKLQSLLEELFRADAADLTSGIYRIINYRRKEIETFIDEELPTIVNKALDANVEAESAHERVTELEEKVREFSENLGREVLDADGNLINEDDKQFRIVQQHLEAREQLGSPQTKTERADAVFNHLWTFFSRYYDNGDFIPRRRYSQTERYTVPYNGEEVYLHWANRDQYYVKSGEHFPTYRFTSQGITVIFDLRDVDVEKDNVKGVKRFFIPLSTETTYSPETDEICIPFEYRPLTDAEKKKYSGQKQQDKIIDAAQPEIIAAARAVSNSDNAYKLLGALEHKTDDVTALKKHLCAYTRSNTADFFIHKDLKQFLNHELDVYIKNEVMPLSSLIFDNANLQENSLTRVNWIETGKLVHCIASKIVDFLAHIEEFQKRLWLKKKFVLSTDYCLTLDRVPEEFYSEIVQNAAQLEEWKDLFAIHEIDNNSIGADYTEPLSVDFLKENLNLVLDTCHFKSDFKDQLLANFDNLDNEIDGLLIHGENFQALNLLAEKYRESIRCIHIDPPYNTESSGFLYKNTYRHSSWLSMMTDRLILAEQFMAPDSCILCHIDENEYENLFQIFNILPLEDQGTIVWDKRNPVFGTKTIATQHEYIISHSKGNIKLLARSLNRKTILREAASLIKKHDGVSEKCRKEFRAWVKHKPELSGGERAYSNIDDEGKVYRGVSMAAPAQETGPKFKDPLIHPITKKPCPVPANGWSRKPETMQEHLEKCLILFGKDERKIPELKIFLEDYRFGELSSLIPCGEKGKNTIDAMGLTFPYCHPVSLYEQLTWAVIPHTDDISLDFFAGSGTTAHATINLNRKDNSKRKYM